MTQTGPTTATPYVLRDGQGRCHLVAGQMIRTLADTVDTAGGFGAVVCDAPLDRFPIPMHWHEREHDTWLCTRGQVQVWCGQISRVLMPGDFAYVVPGDVHSYQSVAPRSRFFGVVAPGGWEQFFVDAGEPWDRPGLPPQNHPYDFRRMGPAVARHGIMQVKDPVYVPASDGGAADQALPAGHASYVLRAGHGTRRSWRKHLCTDLLTAAQSKSMLDMRVIEAGHGSTLPAMMHQATHLLIHVVDGVLALELDGHEHLLAAGDSANIPAGTRYATRVDSGSARWVITTANGNAATLWDALGTPTDSYSYPLDEAAADPVLPGDVDVTLAG